MIYLVFNEGYAASSGASLTRHDLSAEAIRLGRLLVELLPEPEAIGLLALMLLHESRRAARTSAAGELILLDDQDRSLWDRAQIAEGSRWSSGRCATRPVRPVHACRRRSPPCTPRRPTAAATDWAEIVGLYDVLLRSDPSPVVELNRAVAVAMRDGPAAGLALVDAILARGDLRGLPARPRGARRSVPAARPHRGRAGGLRAGARAHAAGARATVPRAPARGAAEIASGVDPTTPDDCRHRA